MAPTRTRSASAEAAALAGAASIQARVGDQARTARRRPVLRGAVPAVAVALGAAVLLAVLMWPGAQDAPAVLERPGWRRTAQRRPQRRATGGPGPSSMPAAAGKSPIRSFRAPRSRGPRTRSASGATAPRCASCAAATGRSSSGCATHTPVCFRPRTCRAPSVRTRRLGRLGSWRVLSSAHSPHFGHARGN
jgi:hypothetical protein